MKCLVLLFASLACASAQVFSVESGLYTPEWIRDQAFDDLDVYYEQAFQDEGCDPEFPEFCGGDEGGEPEPPTEPPAPNTTEGFVVTPGCRIGGGKNPFCKPNFNCFKSKHPICNGRLIKKCLRKRTRLCRRLARL